jgi:hypothetical protein
MSASFSSATEQKHQYYEKHYGPNDIILPHLEAVGLHDVHYTMMMRIAGLALVGSAYSAGVVYLKTSHGVDTSFLAEAYDDDSMVFVAFFLSFFVSAGYNHFTASRRLVR